MDDVQVVQADFVSRASQRHGELADRYLSRFQGFKVLGFLRFWGFCGFEVFKVFRF